MLTQDYYEHESSILGNTDHVITFFGHIQILKRYLSHVFVIEMLLKHLKAIFVFFKGVKHLVRTRQVPNYATPLPFQPQSFATAFWPKQTLPLFRYFCGFHLRGSRICQKMTPHTALATSWKAKGILSVRLYLLGSRVIELVFPRSVEAGLNPAVFPQSLDNSSKL